MSDASAGRRLVLQCLAIIVAITIALSWFAGTPSSAVTTYGRPVAAVLAGLLVWQGRLWARWLLVWLGLGPVLAGPIAMAKGIPFSSPYGLLFWGTSVLYLACLLALFFAPAARAYFATLSQPASPKGGSAAG
jgi:hypothetical protein